VRGHRSGEGFRSWTRPAPPYPAWQDSNPSATSTSVNSDTHMSIPSTSTVSADEAMQVDPSPTLPSAALPLGMRRGHDVTDTRSAGIGFGFSSGLGLGSSSPFRQSIFALEPNPYLHTSVESGRGRDLFADNSSNSMTSTSEPCLIQQLTAHRQEVIL
jgi:hypothetical protein